MERCCLHFSVSHLIHIEIQVKYSWCVNTIQTVGCELKTACALSGSLFIQFFIPPLTISLPGYGAMCHMTKLHGCVPPETEAPNSCNKKQAQQQYVLRSLLKTLSCVVCGVWRDGAEGVIRV